jgi:cellulose synthase/poly-beta-1,6-N-acetylglucosamine synthase-like glycosyltransferase
MSINFLKHLTVSSKNSQNFQYFQKIRGSRKISNYILLVFLLFGGLCFSLIGLSTYLNINLLPFINSQELIFIPQGIIMLFYGVLSIILAIFTFFTILLDLGSGYNIFNKSDNLITLFRKSIPGKNRYILLTYSISNVKSIGIKLVEGLNPSRIIYLKLKDNRQIPMTSIQKLQSIIEIENQATELAEYLNVNIESL